MQAFNYLSTEQEPTKPTLATATALTCNETNFSQSKLWPAPSYTHEHACIQRILIAEWLHLSVALFHDGNAFTTHVSAYTHTMYAGLSHNGVL